MAYEIPEMQYESSGRYSLKNPVDKNGNMTNYFQILLTIARLGHAKKVEILKETGYDLTYTFDHYGHTVTRRAEVGGYLSSLFTLFTKAGLAEYDPKSRTWSLGPNFVEYVNTYVNPVK